MTEHFADALADFLDRLDDAHAALAVGVVLEPSGAAAAGASAMARPAKI